MSFDNHKNFGYSVVATAPTPAASGTTIVVAAGDGAKFPAAPFNAVVWPTGTQPTSANAEIVRVTAKATDTFTVTRTQESTSARTIVVGDQISNAITAKLLTDIEGSLTDVGLTFTDVTTNDVSTAKHGFTPKAPNDVSKFLRGDASYGRIVNVVTTTSTGSQNDFAPGLISGAINVVRCNNASDLTLTGLSASNLVDGTVVIFESINASGNVFFKNQDASSAAANRFTNIATSASTAISLGTATFINDTTSATWRLVSHDQGAFISYTPTWTSSGTQPAIGNGTIAGKYKLIGRQVLFQFQFAAGTTTTFGTATYSYGLPPYTAVNTAHGTFAAYILDTGTQYYAAVGLLATTSVFGVTWHANTAGLVSATTPMTWANGDQMKVTGFYETT